MFFIFSHPSPPKMLQNASWMLSCFQHWKRGRGRLLFTFSKFSNRVLPPIFISTILQSVRKEHTTSDHTRPDSRHHLLITKQNAEWKWQLRKRQSVGKNQARIIKPVKYKVNRRFWKFSSVKKVFKVWKDFPYDVKLRLLPHSREFFSQSRS